MNDTVYGFFAMAGRTKYINRWGLKRNLLPENVKEHCMDTALLAHGLALIAREIYSVDVDPAHVTVVALLHDLPEVLTGDMPTPIKYYNTVIRETYGEVEDAAKKRLTAMLPDALAPLYESLLSEDTEDGRVKRIIKAADKLAAYIKCIEERKAGNHEFGRAEQQIRLILGDLCQDLPELRYFIEHFLPAYELSVDELGI